MHEHAASFGNYSSNRYFYLHQDDSSVINVDSQRFDAIALHYSVRLPYDQVSKTTCSLFENFRGLKVLYIQDEYDHTHKAWAWIKKLKINLVFTVVPAKNVEKIYPAKNFPGVRFISVLTGYVPYDLSGLTGDIPPSKRSIQVGYRGRPLPSRYGQLGEEKVQIGKMVKAYCLKNGIPCDIEWTEEARIYGPSWYDFMKSCRAMLGSESGSNVFDWNGDLQQKITEFREENPDCNDQEVYNAVVAAYEAPGLMNQISPRIFEAIAARTVLVLFEGTYSNVLKSGVHYLALRKDGSNLAEISAALNDSELIDSMADRAYEEIIGEGNYGYSEFVRKTDLAISDWISQNKILIQRDSVFSSFSIQPSLLTTMPVRALSTVVPPAITFPLFNAHLSRIVLDWLVPVWMAMPAGIRTPLTPVIKKILRAK
ncbi:hypothetical protein ACFX58_07170 [Sphingomonas sp. NCPPB 2930]